MYRAVIPLLLLCLIITWPAPYSAAEGRSVITMKSAAERALERNEQLKIRDADVEQSLARYNEALAALYPNLRAGITQQFRNSSATTVRSSSEAGQVFSDRNRHQAEATITVSQPLFTGFRESLIAEAFSKETEAIRLQRLRDQDLLYLDVATLYSQAVLYENDLKILSDTLKTLDKRINELSDWITLGKSRESEVLQAQAERALNISLSARTEGLLHSTREFLASLIGVPESTLSVQQDTAPTATVSLDTYLARTQERADIRAAAVLKDASEKTRIAAERERWPTLSFEGNAYPYTDPELEREWDVQLRMDIPIFDGGAISARVAQAEAEETRRRFQKDLLSREAERDIRAAFQEFQAARKEYTALQEQVSVTQKSFKSLQTDYANGVVSNLDVLRSLTQLQEARRGLLSAETGVNLSRIKLEVAAGGVSP